MSLYNILIDINKQIMWVIMEVLEGKERDLKI